MLADVLAGPADSWYQEFRFGGSFRGSQTMFCSYHEGGLMWFAVERNSMFSHVMVGSNDIARSKNFYDALFGAIGGKPGAQDAKGRLIYAHNGGLFLVSKPIDGKAATCANGGTIGFAMAGPEQADAWHKAGVANGGTAIEDPPGVRQGGAGPMYLAYLRDPDGNKLCALLRMPAA
jgi:catechol 2,3-dioxygenase-like lactoylglutathione lyase family enzyme